MIFIYDQPYVEFEGIMSAGEDVELITYPHQRILDYGIGTDIYP